MTSWCGVGSCFLLVHVLDGRLKHLLTIVTNIFIPSSLLIPEITGEYLIIQKFGERLSRPAACLAASGAAREFTWICAVVWARYSGIYVKDGALAVGNITPFNSMQANQGKIESICGNLAHRRHEHWLTAFWKLHEIQMHGRARVMVGGQLKIPLLRAAFPPVFFFVSSCFMILRYFCLHLTIFHAIHENWLICR